MSIKMKCQYCDAVCGVREPAKFRLMKGATVEITATCRTCNEPKEYKPDPNFDINDLLSQFGMKK